MGLAILARPFSLAFQASDAAAMESFPLIGRAVGQSAMTGECKIDLIFRFSGRHWVIDGLFRKGASWWILRYFVGLLVKMMSQNGENLGGRCRVLLIFDCGETRGER